MPTFSFMNDDGTVERVKALDQATAERILDNNEALKSPSMKAAASGGSGRGDNEYMRSAVDAVRGFGKRAGNFAVSALTTLPKIATGNNPFKGGLDRFKKREQLGNDAEALGHEKEAFRQRLQGALSLVGGGGDPDNELDMFDRETSAEEAGGSFVDLGLAQLGRSSGAGAANRLTRSAGRDVAAISSPPGSKVLDLEAAGTKMAQHGDVPMAATRRSFREKVAGGADWDELGQPTARAGGRLGEVALESKVTRGMSPARTDLSNVLEELGGEAERLHLPGSNPRSGALRYGKQAELDALTETAETAKNIARVNTTSGRGRGLSTADLHRLASDIQAATPDSAFSAATRKTVGSPEGQKIASRTIRNIEERIEPAMQPLNERVSGLTETAKALRSRPTDSTVNRLLHAGTGGVAMGTLGFLTGGAPGAYAGAAAGALTKAFFESAAYHSLSANAKITAAKLIRDGRHQQAAAYILANGKATDDDSEPMSERVSRSKRRRSLMSVTSQENEQE